MRHLNIDWTRLIGSLDTWAVLSDESRRTLVQLKPNQYLRNQCFDAEDLELLLARRLLIAGADGTRVRLHPNADEFSKAMRAMHRHRFDATSDDRALGAYASDHLTTEERQALLHGSDNYYSYAGNAAYHLATQSSWPRQVIEMTSASAALKWERTRQPNRPASSRFEDGSPYFADEALFHATKKLIKAALTWTGPAPLADLARLVPDVDAAMLWRAIMPAVRYLWLFVWLEGEASTPVIGVWPQIAHLLHRPAPEAPRPVEPRETFHAPLLIEDMTTALVSAAAEPLRVLATGDGLYAKDIQRVASAAMALPNWLTSRTDPDGDEQPAGFRDERRIPAAVQACLDLKLLVSREFQRDRYRIEIAQPGRDWLAVDMHDRIRAMIEPWRPAPQANGRAKARRRAPASHLMMYDDMNVSDGRDLSPWTPAALRWAGGPEIGKIDWRAAFVDLLADAADAFVPMVDLLTYHSRVNNPLLGRRRQGTYGAKPQLHAFGYGQRNISETQLENMWFELAGAQIAHTIIPLGAVELGWTPQTPETPDKPNTPSLRLHPIGRYMLGLTDDFDYHARPEGDVIIQPNFDVTFLGPSPRAEAKLGRLAERTGSRVGTLFRITRISILAAAAAGLTADQALSDLAEVSSKPLPENVKREVRGWFNATRHVHLRRTCLIDSPDAHTTTKVLAAAGKHAHQLTPTLVEITIPKKDQTTLIRKLKLSGIFVQ